MKFSVLLYLNALRTVSKTSIRIKQSQVRYNEFGVNYPFKETGSAKKGSRQLVARFQIGRSTNFRVPRVPRARDIHFLL